VVACVLCLFDSGGGAASPDSGAGLAFCVTGSLATLVLATLGLAAQSLGAVGPTTVQDIADLVTQLDAPELEVRERATRALRLRADGLGPSTDGAMTAEQELKAIIEQFRTRELSLEQETRLSLVARDLFTRTDRAGMGVSFAMELVEGGVGIAGTIRDAGFFAHEVLQPGDLIRSADGLPVTTRSEIRAAVLSHDPGDIMVLGIVRNGTPRKVDLKLGNFSQLRNAESPELRVLDAAWKLRLNRELNRDQAEVNKSARPIVSGLLDEDRWADLERGLIFTRQKLEQQAQATGRKVPDRTVDAWDGPPRTIVAGGQPRRGKHYNLDGISRGDEAARFVNLDRNAIQMRLQQSQMMIQSRLIMIENLSDRLNQPGLDARSRMLLEAQIASEKNTVRRLEGDVEIMQQLLQPR